MLFTANNICYLVQTIYAIYCKQYMLFSANNNTHRKLLAYNFARSTTEEKTTPQRRVHIYMYKEGMSVCVCAIRTSFFFFATRDKQIHRKKEPTLHDISIRLHFQTV